MRKGDRVVLNKEAENYGLDIECPSGTVAHNPKSGELVSVRFDDGPIRRIHKDFVDVTPSNEALLRKVKKLIANYQWDGRDAEQQQGEIALEIIRICELESKRGSTAALAQPSRDRSSIPPFSTTE